MKKALIGFGGHAREVMTQMGKDLVCFVDDEYVVEGTKSISEFDPKKYKVMIAIANPEIRKQILSKLPKNTKFFSWIHPTSLELNNVEIGEGSFIGAYSIVTTDIKIGNHCILNRMNQIGHDCTIGDFFSAMAGSVVSGNVSIGNNCYMGNNSSIREKLSVHSLTTIGMNSAVVKDIEYPGTYVGCPSKMIKR
jgi:sugar O-acyltransferase (sialic acid O-acetyltransferase NeuD family)